MIILGIDPGSLNVGYGILQVEKRKIVAAGCDTIVINPKLQLSERLVHIHSGLNKIIA